MTDDERVNPGDAYDIMRRHLKGDKQEWMDKASRRMGEERTDRMLKFIARRIKIEDEGELPSDDVLRSLVGDIQFTNQDDRGRVDKAFEDPATMVRFKEILGGAERER